MARAKRVAWPMRSRDPPRLAGAEQVARAAAAERRVPGVDADVFAVVPATLALGGRADAGVDEELVAVGGVARAEQLRRRGDEHELQFVAERRELGQARRAGLDGHDRLQRRTDAAFGAQHLDLAVAFG